TGSTLDLDDMGGLISLITGDSSLPSEDKLPVIYITGFSKFWNFPVNSSEEALKKLQELNLDKRLKCRIVIEILSVSYKDINSIIPKKWEELKPKLVIHVGMKNNTDKLMLEQMAHNTGYQYFDNHRMLPKNNICIPGGEEVIESGICMKMASQAINENGTLKSDRSTNAGRFICEYVYYLSLHQDRLRSAFIHVPPIEENLSASDIATGLAVAVEALYQQVLELDCK
ncbi:hypothetical protein OTU49_003284, partial [Cherax quadricarinatus]